ncbi:MAG: MFS transporter [Oscillospiraceae bacterium]|nr:MFS transporter [Oscillospiraceae bacterium]
MCLLLLAVIYLAFISLGLPDSLLGAGWPVMHEFFGVPLAWAGVVTMVISVGTVMSSLLSERLTKRFGVKYVTLFSIIVTALAMWGFSISTSFPMLIAFAIPYGLGAGSIDAALNNYVALHYSSKHMSWLHCFWGVGTIMSPCVMSAALSVSVWQTGYRAVGAVQLVIAAIVALSLPLWKADSDPKGAGNTVETVGVSGALRIRGVPTLLAGFLCYCGAESICMLWSASYLIEKTGMAPSRAAAFASLFFIGMTVGRFLAGFISDRVGDRNMIRLGTGIIAVGVVLISLNGLPESAALVGLVIIGLGCAPVYPSIIHSTPASFGAENSQAIIGVQMASAYLGSTFMPPALGFVSSLSGLWVMPFFLIVLIALMTVLLEATYRKRA